VFHIGVKKIFSAAHFLRGYKGKCEGLHGHNWLVEAEVRGKDLDELGMIMDFGDLKKKVDTVLADLDHRLLNEHPYFSQANPSSEHLARFIFEELARQLDGGIEVEQVTVWESERCWARYDRKETTKP